MKPFYFDGCFGWLHASAVADAAVPSASVGVVLCSTFAQEEVCTHYGVMALADELAAMGMPTVRFDYRGTGNSSGVMDDVTFASMVGDAERAAAYLRAHCSVGTVVLAGVRLGAAVALRAAGFIPNVGALVLMAPALSGQAFLREIRAAAKVGRLSGLDPVLPPESGVPLNANGFHWSTHLQNEIDALDLTATAPLPIPTLLLTARNDRRAAKLAEAWRAQNAPVTEQPFTDYDGWMQDPTTSTIPAETFANIRAWLSELKLEAAQQTATQHTQVAVADVLRGDNFIEQPMQFGPGNVLFGILCRPREHAAAPVAALLLHEGSSHTIGNGGAYVTLARRMAEAGIASLRMDLTGVGDSPGGGNTRHPHYDPERIPECIAGIDVLEARGYPMAMVYGLCSGAYTALQVTLADKRVVGNVIVNLQKFLWHYGDDIRVAQGGNRRSFKGYVRALSNPGEWRRTLSGDVNVLAIARVLMQRTASRMVHTVRGLLPPAPDSDTARVRQNMRTLAERRVQSNLIFSDDDPGLSDMYTQFGRKGYRLAAYAPARMLLLDRADHHFNATAARQRYYDLAVSMIKAVIAERAVNKPLATAAPARTARRIHEHKSGEHAVQ